MRSAKGAVPEGKTEKLGGGALRQKRKARGTAPEISLRAVVPYFPCVHGVFLKFLKGNSRGNRGHEMHRDGTDYVREFGFFSGTAKTVPRSGFWRL